MKYQAASAPPILALLAMLLATEVPVFASPASCGKSRPQSSAAELYRKHRGFQKDPPKNLLSRSLYRLTKTDVDSSSARGEVGAVDWDFWSSAQDGETSENVSVSSTKVQGSRATTRLKYTFQAVPHAKPKEMVARIVLIREADGCWRVDDVVRDRRSFKALLLRAQSKPG